MCICVFYNLRYFIIKWSVKNKWNILKMFIIFYVKFKYWDKIDYIKF